MKFRWIPSVERVVLGLMLVGALSGVSCQKNEAELAQLRQEHAELEQLRAQVQELQKGQVSEAEVARLKKENEEVHRLRNEVRQLREEIKVAQAQAKAPPPQNPQLATENTKLKTELEQLKQTTANANALSMCVNNLRQIAGATQAWATQHQKPPGSPISPADQLEIAKLIPGGRIPQCPAGGAYGILVVGANPQCSVPGHVMQ